jgi:hypothetical protein
MSPQTQNIGLKQPTAAHPPLRMRLGDINTSLAVLLDRLAAFERKLNGIDDDRPEKDSPQTVLGHGSNRLEDTLERIEAQIYEANERVDRTASRF